MPSPVSTASIPPLRRRGRKGRPIVMQHIRTGRIISAPSIAEFCRKARLNRNARFHFDNVLKGHRLSHLGWGLPTTLNEQLHLKDPYGNRISGTVAQLSRKLSTTALNRLRNGGVIQGIAPAHLTFGGIAPLRPLVQGYTIRHGQRTITVDTLKQVGNLMGKSIGPAFKLVHGLSTYPGTEIVDVKTEARNAFHEYTQARA